MNGKTKEKEELFRQIVKKIYVVYDDVLEARDLTSDDEVADILSRCEDEMDDLLEVVSSSSKP